MSEQEIPEHRQMRQEIERLREALERIRRNPGRAMHIADAALLPERGDYERGLYYAEGSYKPPERGESRMEAVDRERRARGLPPLEPQDGPKRGLTEEQEAVVREAAQKFIEITDPERGE